MDKSKFSKDETTGIGTFKLSVAFDYDPAEDEIDYVENVFFPKVSELLSKATYEQHNLDKIVIVDPASDDKDILIVTDRDTRVAEGRIWNNGYLRFSRDHLYSPGLMQHELSHYLYDLRDEHLGCRNNPDVGCSIMEYDFSHVVRFKRISDPREYNVIHNLEGPNAFWDDLKNGEKIELIETDVATDYCNDYNGTPFEHNPDSITDQNNIHFNVVNRNRVSGGRSCWDVLTDDTVGGEERGDEYKYGLIEPTEEQFSTRYTE